MIVLKIYDVAHSAPHVHRIGEFPCRVGRSVHSHVVIDHPSISGEHAIIEDRAEGPVLRDLKSTNGVFYQDKKVSEVALTENLALYMGPVRIEVIVREEELERTQEFNYHPSEVVANRQTPAWMVASIHILASGTLAIAAFVEFLLLSYDRKKDVAYASFFGAVVLAYGLAFLASVGAKIHSKRYHFTQMTIYGSAFVLYLMLFYCLKDAVIFNIQTWFNPTWIMIIVSCLVYAWVTYKVGGIISPSIPKTKLLRNVTVLMVCLTSIYFGAQSLLNSDSQRFDFYSSLGVPYLDSSQSIENSAMSGVSKVDQMLDQSVKKIAEFREEAIEERDRPDHAD